jgi:uncharacterized membrane protein YagU involved in acid resistance
MNIVNTKKAGVTVKDRFVAGGLAGAFAGLIQYAYGIVSKASGLTDRQFGQFSESVLNLHVYTGVLGLIIGVLSHMAVSIIFGVLFAYIIQITSSRYYMLKGAMYGLVLWFLLSGFGSVLRLPNFTKIPPLAELDILGGAILYGLVLAYSLKLLERNTKVL